MTLMFLAWTFLGEFVTSNELAIMALCVIPPLHMHRQLKDAYELSTFSAAWRALALALFALIALVLFLLVLVGWGLFD